MHKHTVTATLYSHAYRHNTWQSHVLNKYITTIHHRTSKYHVSHWHIQLCKLIETNTYTHTQTYTNTSVSWHCLEESERKVTLMILIIRLYQGCLSANTIQQDRYDGKPMTEVSDRLTESDSSNRLIFLQAAVLSAHNDKSDRMEVSVPDHNSSEMNSQTQCCDSFSQATCYSFCPTSHLPAVSIIQFFLHHKNLFMVYILDNKVTAFVLNLKDDIPLIKFPPDQCMISFLSHDSLHMFQKWS